MQSDDGQHAMALVIQKGGARARMRNKKGAKSKQAVKRRGDRKLGKLNHRCMLSYGGNGGLKERFPKKQAWLYENMSQGRAHHMSSAAT